MKDLMVDATLLIPAAGFGRRVGQPESKEMLPRPGFDHMIDFSLSLAAQFGIAAHVIVREEKLGLMAHLEALALSQKLTIQIVGETREWPDTILLSEPFWRERNLVVLPDSDFSPVSVVPDLFRGLLGSPSAWAVFGAEDLRSWGVIDVLSRTHAEKPRKVAAASARPWGLFGFQKSYGRRLCEQLLQSTLSGGEWLALDGSVASVNLEHYQDLTR